MGKHVRNLLRHQLLLLSDSLLKHLVTENMYYLRTEDTELSVLPGGVNGMLHSR